MIKVICSDESLKSSIYEFLIQSFPSYHKKKYMKVEIGLTNSTINIESNDFRVKDNIKLNSNIEIKRQVYKILENYIEKGDWGILTGIRPSKLARNLILDKGYSNTDHILNNYYFLNEEKRSLIINIAKREIDFIKNLDRGNYSIYVNIPFCKSRCIYCNFNTISNSNLLVEEYIDTLIKDLITESKYFNNPPTTVYIGGGTPSSISMKNLSKVINTILKYYGKPIEFTVECGKEDSITLDLLKMLKFNGVDRISVNPQTVNSKTLSKINRHGKISDLIKKYQLAKSLDFNSINMDLILGLPNENIYDMKYSIEKVAELEPENITVHNLSLKKGSKLWEYGFFNSDNNKIIDFSKKFLEEKAYNPYYLYRQKNILSGGENIGYSKINKECLYNILMIEEVQSIIGFGMSSSSKFYNSKTGKINLVMNFKNLKDYLTRGNEILKKKEKYYNKLFL
ncbi:MAG: coproporphyrinogen dehydrogenase HemZ [Peptoniphilaceae bacterium]